MESAIFAFADCPPCEIRSVRFNTRIKRKDEKTMSKRVMVITAILIVGLMASLGLATAMQQDSTKDSSMKKDSTQSSSTLSSDDRKFIMEAAHGGMMEVELGKLAVDKASSADVKQFAQRMVDDHSKANDELMQLASQKGVTISADHAMMHGDDHTSMSDNSTGAGKTSTASTDQTNTANTGQMSGASKDHQGMMKAQATKDKLSKT